MDMAERILDANPVSTGEKRNRVVIMFTDGSPTDSSGFQKSVANDAITTANNIKAAGATVYSIGVFSGADANSEGTEPNGNLQQGDNQMNAACNWFMQKVSSNNGTPRRPSYYLSAADAGALNNIFQQISDQIESGGTSSTLTKEAVVKDIISPQFTLPAGATADDITLETYACTGKDANGNYTWKKNADAMGATATVEGDKVNVTGFNFSENYVGTVTENGNTSYRGNKLVISFKVKPKADFLGGNNVYTNTSAGIYENDKANDPILTFDRPTVNVPIPEVKVTAQDKNVYLLGEVTADQLKSGATVKVGDVTLDLSKDNYGLEDWQTEYVDITVKITDEDSNEVDTIADLKDDTTYTIQVTVAPKPGDTAGSSGAAATAKSGKDEAKINVFKPEIDFKDSAINLGDKADYEKDNKVPNSLVWKHGDTEASEDMGAAPDLTFEYDPAADAFMEDTPVKVTVKIGNKDVTVYTTFYRKECTFDGCEWTVRAEVTDDVNFIVHIKTFDLTITKSGAEDIDENQSFLFTVEGPDGYSAKVVIRGNKSVTIKGLKVGEYTITEETGWSWRYTPDGASKGVTANDVSNGKATVTFINNRTKDKWLGGDAYARNLFSGNSGN